MKIDTDCAHSCNRRSGTSLRTAGLLEETIASILLKNVQIHWESITLLPTISLTMCSLFCCSVHLELQEPDITLAIDPSATSFLNGQLMDQSGHPLYTIETAEAHTILTSTRQQRQSQRRSRSSTVARIQWPKRFTTPANGNRATAPDALVTVNGETIPSRRLLRRRKLVGLVILFSLPTIHIVLSNTSSDGKSYKFRIDGYKPTFRWKRQGRQYQVLTSNRTHRNPSNNPSALCQWAQPTHCHSLERLPHVDISSGDHRCSNCLVP
jgi:hypothetical protein